jgi:hypothetical protein
VARANLFANQKLAYAAAPGLDGIYEHRANLDVLTRGMANAQQKIILGTTSTNQIFQLNLESKLRGLGNDITIPANGK